MPPNPQVISILTRLGLPAVLATEFEWVKKLNSQARQAATERARSAIARFLDNCKTAIPGKKGYPKFQKDNRSVEYKATGWKLADDRKSISDASWGLFVQWLGYFGQVFGKIVVSVPPQYTSQDCANCGQRVPKSLSTRTHTCTKCGYSEYRDVSGNFAEGIEISFRKVPMGSGKLNAWGELDLYSE